ncbi:MAG: hypothetical protein KGI27_02690 [Thaumarchaeota archaeon]|nr:hypothetical protein [Nitrososphaerota archaeon]
MNRNHGRAESILVGLAVEQALLHIGKPVFDKVETLLHERYNCTISDSYDSPQFLREILKEVFGKSYYLEAVGSIEDFLREFRYNKSIEQFIEKINV